MLEYARRARAVLSRFSEMYILGVPVDWFFHLAGAMLIFFLASRFLSLKRSLQFTILLLVGKEVFDIFAKTRIEYIRPPTIDLAVDFTAGAFGIALGYILARRYQSRQS